MISAVGQNGKASGLHPEDYRFKSYTAHQIIRGSSMAERPAVNRLVVGSNPTLGARMRLVNNQGSNGRTPT